MTLINTNLRSLCPKVNSLVECFEELDAAFRVLTETWLTDGEELQDKLDDLSAGSGIGMVTKNRPANTMGFSHGGVAIAFRESCCSFKEVHLLDTQGSEIVAAVARFPGYSRQLVVVGCYLPPTYSASEGAAALDRVTQAVIEIKRRFRSPYIIVAGDFNQWEVDKALIDFIDLVEADVGPTRGSRSIDRIFSNFGGSIGSAYTVPPIQADDPGQGRPSDHRVAVVTADLPRIDAFRWLKYSYRFYNEESVEKFRKWIALEDWNAVVTAADSNSKAEAYQSLVDRAIEDCFPLVTVRRKSTDLPWVNAKARRLIKRRKAVYRSEGRSASWKRLKRALDELLKDRKRTYEASQKLVLLASHRDVDVRWERARG